METPSAFLAAVRPGLRAVAERLGPRYDRFTLLGADSAGTNFEAMPAERRATESMWSERGFVARAVRGGAVAEKSFDAFSASSPAEARAFAYGLGRDLDALLEAPAPGGRLAMAPGAEPAPSSRIAADGDDPLALEPEVVLDRLEAIRARAAGLPRIAMARTRAEWVRVAKLFVSPEAEAEQAWLWGQAYVIVAARHEGKTRQTFGAVSGLKGLALLDELEDGVPERTAATAAELLEAVPLEGGEYEVVLTPDMAGMLAHEAFGHGVETDMIAKGRALAGAYMGRRVGSPLVSMYDGAAAAEQTGSYAFDDEGVPASSTLVLDRGILVRGISDLLSARELGIPATGNGRRWSFERKAYARMTNTFFAPGDTPVEDMIAGVKRGWLLDRPNSGMEDPKNWGIQLVALVGREIVDGKLTGRVASPVVCTGYVPDVLGAVDAVSAEVELKGNGYCGKGYKEYVKVSSGGPWMRTKMRLG